MPEPSEGVPPKATGSADEELAALRTVGEQQLRDGLFLDAVKTLTTALDLANSAGATDEGNSLEKLHEDAMQKAALVRVPRCAEQPASQSFHHSAACLTILPLLPLLRSARQLLTHRQRW